MSNNQMVRNYSYPNPYNLLTRAELEVFEKSVQMEKCECGHYGYQHEFTMGGIISRGQCGCFGEWYCPCGRFEIVGEKLKCGREGCYCSFHEFSYACGYYTDCSIGQRLNPKLLGESQ